MPGKLNTVEVKFWLSEAKSCEDRQRIELIQRNNYPFLVNYYEGIERLDDLHPHVATSHKLAVINEYFPNTNSLISDIMFKNPDILLDALKPQAEDDTPLMKSALTYFFDKAEGLIENRVALFDMIYAGYCAVEVDFIDERKKTTGKDEGESDNVPKDRESVFDKFKKGFKKATTTEEAERNLAKLSPPMETNFATVQGTYIRRYDPLDVPLDWRADRIKDRRYNFKKVWMSKAEFDVKYPKFESQVGAEERKFDFSQHAMMMHNRKVLLYEFQVRMRGGEYKTIIISPQVGTSEIDTFDRPYTTNGFNMKIGSLHKYGKLYPRSLAQVNKKMQDEMNNYVRHMMNVAQKNLPKRVADRGKVKADAIAALNNTIINDLALVDGNPTTAVVAAPHTNVSIENKELLVIFADQKAKLWSRSEPKIAGKANVKFARELNVQEAGAQSNEFDLQEGLRFLIQDELDTGKDIIASFWDGEVFLKVTGSDKMDWYEPVLVPDPNNSERSIVSNPLTDILTGDYNVGIDIASARRPNRQEQLSNMSFFMNQLVQIRQILIDQGKDINIEEIKRISKEFGWNPDKLLVDFNPAGQPTVPTAGGETISPEEDASREAQAQEQVAGGQPVGGLV